MVEWQCPLCKTNQAGWPRADIGASTEGSHELVCCRQCGLFSLQRRPGQDELVRYYPPDYEPFWGPSEQEPNPWVRWTHRRHYAVRCAAIRRAHPGGGHLLDLGCGTGGLLRELRRDGKWYGVGVDVNEHALDIARRQGIEVQCGELADLRLPAASFDVVTLWEVIEHLPDPVGALSEIHRLLKPSGLILMSTPNSSSWQARVWQGNWAGWDMPRHLQVFTEATLRQLLERTGFEIVSRLSLPMERFYLMFSAGCWLRNHTGRPAGTIAQGFLSMLGMAMWPALRVIDHMPWSSTISCVARRLA